MSRKIYRYKCPHCGGIEKSHYSRSEYCAYCGKPYPKYSQFIATIYAYLNSIL